MIEERKITVALEAGSRKMQLPPDLLDKINRQADELPPIPWWRLWRKPLLGVASALVVVLTVGVAAAQGGLLWKFLYSGRPVAPPPTRTPGGQPYNHPYSADLRPDEASRLVGFQVKLPTVLPDGVLADDVTANVRQSGANGQPEVLIGYWRVQDKGNGNYSTQRALTLYQKLAGETPWYKPPETISTPQGTLQVKCDSESVLLRPGVRATWFACDKGDSFLTWMDAGMEFRLSAFAKHDEAQLIEIARSIRDLR